MENKQIVSAAGTQDNSIMKPVDQKARSKGRSDIMTRRLKNRERQRRYRARKRLEAQAAVQKTYVVKETTPVQAELQSNGNHNNFVTRVYCKRDWKKDARRVHARRHQEMSPNESIDASPTLPGEPKASCLAFGNKTGTMLDREIQSGSSSVVTSETPRMVLGRRDWKAEARRKKN